MSPVECPRCGAVVDGLVCAYCGSLSGEVAELAQELEALNQFHGLLQKGSGDSLSNLLRGGFLPTHKGALVEAGVRCVPLISSTDFSAEPSASAVQRLEGIVAKLRLLPWDNETGRAITQFETKIGRSSPRGRQLLILKWAVGSVAFGFLAWFLFTRIPKALDPTFGVVLDAQMYSEGGDGKLYPVKEGMVLSSKDNYCIYVRPDRKSYVYIFQVDTLGKVLRLFPNDRFSQAGNPLNPERQYWIPDAEEAGRTKFMFLDDNPGTETIHFLATQFPVKEFEELEDSEVGLFLKTVQRREASGDIKTMGLAGTRTSAAVAKVPAGDGRQMELVSRRLEAVRGFHYAVSFIHQ